MAGKTTPWWRRAIQFALKGIRTVLRIDPRSRGVVDEIGFNELDAYASLQEKSEEDKTLIQDSPELATDMPLHPTSPEEAKHEPESAATQAENAAAAKMLVEAPTPENVAASEAGATPQNAAEQEPAMAAEPSIPEDAQPEPVAEVEATAVEPEIEAAEPAPAADKSEAPETPVTEPETAEAVEIATPEPEMPELEAAELAAEPEPQPAEAGPAAPEEAVEATEATELAPEQEPEAQPAKSEAADLPVEDAESVELPDEAEPEPTVQEAAHGELEIPQAGYVEEPPAPESAIEETVLEPEVETPESAAEPELDEALEAAAEEEAVEETEEQAEIEAAEPEPEPEAHPAELEAQSNPEFEPDTAPETDPLAETEGAVPAPEEKTVAEPEPQEQPEVQSGSDEEPSPVIELQPEEPQAASARAESETPLPEPAAAVPVPPPAPPTAPAAPPAPEKPVREPIKREEGPENLPFSVMVSQVYEGPLDLLLDLIRKQDIDIYDIPIARITAQFLAYVNQLKASDMDVAGEFIYMASLLIHIKSKMLLPRAPSGPDEGQEDPRRELVERLLEHERFKNAAQMLQQKQMLESASWTNPGLRDFKDDESAEPEIAADTTDLVRVFRDILDRARNRPMINVQEDTVTVGQMIQFLGRRLSMEDKPVALRRLLSHTKSERALIAMFLALLELVRLQAILLRQDRHFSEIFIKKNAGFDAVMNQGLARDDWQ